MVPAIYTEHLITGNQVPIIFQFIAVFSALYQQVMIVVRDTLKIVFRDTITLLLFQSDL